MNISVLLAIENYINSVGLSTIISDGILASNITQTHKENVIQKIKIKSFDILIIDYNKNNPDDFELLNEIVKTDQKIKLLILTSRDIDHKIVRFSNKNHIGFILNTYKYKDIIKVLNFSELNYKTRARHRVIKKVKTQNITSLLSDREFEIALMLIKGKTITTISEEKNLAITTISTYKKRIFEKIKVKNLIEMAKIFNKINHKI
jgi:DNA-binding NarL/FixJ family response regulator